MCSRREPAQWEQEVTVLGHHGRALRPLDHNTPENSTEGLRRQCSGHRRLTSTTYTTPLNKCPHDSADLSAVKIIHVLLRV